MIGQADEYMKQAIHNLVYVFIRPVGEAGSPQRITDAKTDLRKDENKLMAVEIKYPVL